MHLQQCDLSHDLSLSSDQAQGKDWRASIHPRDPQHVLAESRRAAEGQASFQTEFRFLRNDGSIVWARVNSAPMIDGMNDDMDGGTEAQGHVLMVEDISLSKSVEFSLHAAEEALFEEKECAQATLNSIGDAVLTTDLLGNLTYLNPVAEMVTGWSHDEALGLPLAEVFRIIDGKSRQVAVNPAQRAIAEDRIVGLAADSVLVRRDGVESLIEDSAAPTTAVTVGSPAR